MPEPTPPMRNAPPPMRNAPPPLPQVPIAHYATPAPSDSATDYQAVADTVGFVPSLRRSDNAMQAKVFGVAFLLGAIGTGATVLVISKDPDRVRQAAIGAIVVGLVVGFVAVLASGAVLAVVNLFRAGKR